MPSGQLCTTNYLDEECERDDISLVAALAALSPLLGTGKRAHGPDVTHQTRRFHGDATVYCEKPKSSSSVGITLRVGDLPGPPEELVWSLLGR